MERVGRSYPLLSDGVTLRGALIVGIGSIGIDGGKIDSVARQKRKRDGGSAGVFVCDGAHKPTLAATLSARNSKVVSRFGSQYASGVPVDGYIFDELKSIGETLIVLFEIGSHL